MVSTSVSSSGPTTDSYYWNVISPVQLTAGHQYTVDAFVGNNSWSSGGAPIVNSDITYNGQTYLYGSALGFPTHTTGHAADAYYGPNFSIASAPDAGSTMAMLGMGISGLALLRRKL